MKRKEATKDVTVKSEIRVKDSIAYKYELIRRESKNVTSYKLPLYAVAVEIESADGEIKGAETSDIFLDAGKALAFFEMIVDNLVTPIDLEYIIEDELKC